MTSSYFKTFKALCLTALIIGITLCGLMTVGMLSMQFFMALSTIEGFSSGVLFFIGAFVVYKIRPTFDQTAVVVVFVGVLIFFGLIFDSAGNPIYNLPLDWLLAPEGGHFQAASHVSNHRPGSVSVGMSYHVVSATGAVLKDVSSWLVYLFRALNYMMVGVLLVFIGQILPSKQTELHTQLTKPSF